MKMYLVSVSGSASKLDPTGLPKIRELISYFGLRKGSAAAMRVLAPAPWRGELFLDSGAFSAYTRKTSIDLSKYITFIHQHREQFSVYANLDVIGDPVKSWENQLEMERQGLQPLPCFHYGEDTSWLKRYVEQYEHFAFGGMVPLNGGEQMCWLDSLMPFVCDGQGRPLRKFHGFGTCGSNLLFRYPWFSADSTAWMVGGRWGGILLWWGDQQVTFKVAGRCDERHYIGKHISTLSGTERASVITTIEAEGFTLEELVESCEKRDAWNIRFVMNCERRLAEGGERRFLPEGKYRHGFFG